MLRKGLTKNLLIFLGFLADEADAYSYTSQLQRLLCNGWYKKSSWRSTISRLLSVGDIEKIVKNGKVFYRLSSRGQNKLKQNIPIFNLRKKPWDGKWRMVIFDISEKSRYLRDNLRNKLLSLGFGKWQESVYISPFDVEEEMNEYLKSQGLFASAVCLVAKKTGFESDKTLAEKVWRLDLLNLEYEDFIGRCKQLMEKGKDGGKAFKNLWEVYENMLLKDPCLPRELLEGDWLALEARKQLAQVCSFARKIRFG